jgi:hypothetical protein
MFDEYLLTLHCLTLRQLAEPDQIAEIIGLERAEIDTALEKAATDGTVMAARGSHMITPAGRELLDAAYPRECAELRADPAIVAAFERFESGVNKQVLELTTDWQTIEVNGERVPNYHSDAGYDEKLLDRLGATHDKTAKVLEPLLEADARLPRFLDRLERALVRAEGGDKDYVSGARVDSYHTVWFQMHEHLLRLMGWERPE